jgi:hypothetical protein
MEADYLPLCSADGSEKCLFAENYPSGPFLFYECNEI